jgi:hypothetical protein
MRSRHQQGLRVASRHRGLTTLARAAVRPCICGRVAGGESCGAVPHQARSLHHCLPSMPWLPRRAPSQMAGYLPSSEPSVAMTGMFAADADCTEAAVNGQTACKPKEEGQGSLLANVTCTAQPGRTVALSSTLRDGQTPGLDAAVGSSQPYARIHSSTAGHTR